MFFSAETPVQAHHRGFCFGIISAPLFCISELLIVWYSDFQKNLRFKQFLLTKPLFSSSPLVWTPFLKKNPLHFIITISKIYHRYLQRRSLIYWCTIIDIFIWMWVGGAGNGIGYGSEFAVIMFNYNDPYIISVIYFDGL